MLPICLGLSLIAGSILSLEVAFTRVFDPLRPGDTSASLPPHLDNRIRLRATKVL